MPPVGCAAFTWDGVYLGATASRGLFMSMLMALLAFFGCWFAGKALFGGFSAGSSWGPGADLCLHVLLAAYFAHLAARTVYLTAAYRKSILTRG